MDLEMQDILEKRYKNLYLEVFYIDVRKIRNKSTNRKKWYII